MPFVIPYRQILMKTKEPLEKGMDCYPQQRAGRPVICKERPLLKQSLRVREVRPTTTSDMFAVCILCCFEFEWKIIIGLSVYFMQLQHQVNFIRIVQLYTNFTFLLSCWLIFYFHIKTSFLFFLCHTLYLYQYLIYYIYFLCEKV